MLYNTVKFSTVIKLRMETEKLIGYKVSSVPRTVIQGIKFILGHKLQSQPITEPAYLDCL